MMLAARIVLLNTGRIEQIGAPEKIYEHPKTVFVAGLIGTPAMTPSAADAEGDVACLDLAVGRVLYHRAILAMPRRPKSRQDIDNQPVG